MSNSIAPGSSADVNVRVTALTTNPNVPAQYKTIILKKNLVNGVNTLTQEMMSAQNTKYVVKYDYTLGEDITIPTNCVLEFDGGSISGNGTGKDTITGNNTKINDAENIFEDIVIAGTWNAPVIRTSMFKTDNETLAQIEKLLSSDIFNDVYIDNVSANITNRPYAPLGGYNIGLIVPSNTYIHINGTITSTVSPIPYYYVIYIDGDNVTIDGGKIIGDFREGGHQGDTGEWGHGICTHYTCKNITIKNVEVSNCWGDCVNSSGTNVSILNCIIHNARRQGITIGYGDTIYIRGNYIYAIEGTDPQSGIDIEVEPSRENAHINNVLIEGNIIDDCYGGSIQIFNNPTNIFVKSNILLSLFLLLSSENVIIEGNTMGGIRSAHNPKNPIIKGNSIKGLELYNGQDIQILDNIIQGGSFMTGDANCIVERNTIKGTSNMVNWSIGYQNTEISFEQIFKNNIIKNIRFLWNAYSDNCVLSLIDNSIEFNSNSLFLNNDSGGLKNPKLVCKYNTIKEADGHILSGAYLINAAKTGEYSHNRLILNNGSSLLLLAWCGTNDSKYIYANNECVIDSQHISQSGVTGSNTKIVSNNNKTSEDNLARRNEGGTTDRPQLNINDRGFQYFDTTLGKPIYWNGYAWVDATGVTV